MISFQSLLDFCNKALLVVVSDNRQDVQTVGFIKTMEVDRVEENVLLTVNCHAGWSKKASWESWAHQSLRFKIKIPDDVLIDDKDVQIQSLSQDCFVTFTTTTQSQINWINRNILGNT